MFEVKGLTGFKPTKEVVATITTPPYDVIKPGSELEKLLKGRESLVHITLGENPVFAFNNLIKNGMLQEANEPCFYVYEQTWNGNSRLGVHAAVEVSAYSEGKIIRHEKTIDGKVEERLMLAKLTGHTFEPPFLLTRQYISDILKRVLETYTPEYAFVSDFGNLSELHGIRNRIFRLEEESELGRHLSSAINMGRHGGKLYIADGHHRYHAALLGEQKYCMVYITDKAHIQAYNRLINGPKRFSDIKAQLDLTEVSEFSTPPKNYFCIYTRDGIYLLPVKRNPEDVIGRLDCSRLEKELYPLLGITHEMIKDPTHFDYCPESELPKMKMDVDSGKFDIAIALSPVSLPEFFAVADAGIRNPSIVMPEKSTYFSPKILSGLFIMRN